MSCEDCKGKDVQTIPFIVYEASQSRHERTVKRLIVALIIAVILLFAANAAWLYAWTQYDYSGEEISVDAEDGVANYIGERGVINNGENNSTP